MYNEGMTYHKMRYSKLGPRVANALKDRHFEAWYFDEKEDAVAAALSLIPKTDTVSWGGSLTVAGLGITEQLASEGICVLDRDKAATPEERHEIMRKAFQCGTYLTGANAVSEDGQMVNIDRIGNRVAAMIYGPKQVIVFAGMNKVAKTLDDAVTRARTIAAPLNAQRFPGLRTPCSGIGTCHDCRSPDSACSHIVITRSSHPVGRIKVILIGEDLGF
jgi:L-lactate utilization protein LutB